MWGGYSGHLGLRIYIKLCHVLARCCLPVCLVGTLLREGTGQCGWEKAGGSASSSLCVCGFFSS